MMVPYTPKGQPSPMARIMADSISPAGDRLTTMEVVFHRFVLAEFNTHRKFSRNSASSRAIPVRKQLEKVIDDPATPIVWASEQKGMQGGDEVDDIETVSEVWKLAADYAVVHANRLAGLGVHKSIVNRLLEPFLMHTCIVSSTEWDNFFAQRCSPLAQPEIRVVAELMQQALEASEPVELPIGAWHMPYVDAQTIDECAVQGIDPRHVSVARCARVSYLTHDGKRDLAKDEELYQRLVSARPPHASPLEHVATPEDYTLEPFSFGNFDGWKQLRHQVI